MRSRKKESRIIIDIVWTRAGAKRFQAEMESLAEDGWLIVEVFVEKGWLRTWYVAKFERESVEE